MTITEGGYFLDAEGRFDAGHRAMMADAATPDAPKTVFGMILRGSAAAARPASALHGDVLRQHPP